MAAGAAGDPALTPVEERLVRCVGSGEQLDLTGGEAIDDDAMKQWGESRTVRAVVIRDILTGRLVDDPDPRGVRLRGARIEGSLDLRDLTCGSQLELTACYLPDGMDGNSASLPALGLRDCRVEHGIGLLGAHIGGQLNASGARLTNDSGPALEAEAATFSGAAYFSAATFSSRADFSDATFSSEAYFGKATFSSYASFVAATFSSDASFIETTFSSEAYFIDATFSGEAVFVDATFSSEAVFVDATFSGEADFVDATFSGEADFVDATFSSDAVFISATFSGAADFSEATFSSDTYFDSAAFGGDTDFFDATFRQLASFEDATFEQSRKLGPLLAYRGLVLDGVQFKQPVQAREEHRNGNVR